LRATDVPCFAPALGGTLADGSGTALPDRLDQLSVELGFTRYTDGSLGTFDLFCITAALMVGTAGLPHVIVRFYTVPRVAAVRISAGWALVSIAVLYTTAPAIAAFVRTNPLETVPNHRYTEMPDWFTRWEDTDLIAWIDKNDDGVITYTAGRAFYGKPQFAMPPEAADGRGSYGERLLANTPTDGANELYIDCDIMVLANPQISKLPNWVAGLVAAGGLAAALSTAAGLLLVISTSVAHDLLKKTFRPQITERGELLAARVAAGVAVCIARATSASTRRTRGARRPQAGHLTKLRWPRILATGRDGYERVRDAAERALPRLRGSRVIRSTASTISSTSMSAGSAAHRPVRSLPNVRRPAWLALSASRIGSGSKTPSLWRSPSISSYCPVR